MLASSFVIIFLNGRFCWSLTLSVIFYTSSQSDLRFITGRFSFIAEIFYNPHYRRSQPFVDLTVSPRATTSRSCYSPFLDERFSTHLKKNENEIYCKLTIIFHTVIFIKAYYSGWVERKQALSKCNTANQSVVMSSTQGNKKKQYGQI